MNRLIGFTVYLPATAGQNYAYYVIADSRMYRYIDFQD